MKNKDVKKIQQKGWNRYSFSDVREKVKRFIDTDGINFHHKRISLKKKGKRICNKEGHNFMMVEITIGFGTVTRKVPVCTKCGKHDFFHKYISESYNGSTKVFGTLNVGSIPTSETE